MWHLSREKRPDALQEKAQARGACELSSNPADQSLTRTSSGSADGLQHLAGFHVSSFRLQSIPHGRAPHHMHVHVCQVESSKRSS